MKLALNKMIAYGCNIIRIPPIIPAIVTEKSGIGRDINRHYYTPEEIDRAIQRPVVQSLFELIRFRNHHPAFNGSFSMPETRDSGIVMRWDHGVDWAMLDVDFVSGSYSISNSPFELIGPK